MHCCDSAGVKSEFQMCCCQINICLPHICLLDFLPIVSWLQQHLYQATPRSSTGVSRTCGSLEVYATVAPECKSAPPNKHLAHAGL